MAHPITSSSSSSSSIQGPLLFLVLNLLIMGLAQGYLAFLISKSPPGTEIDTGIMPRHTLFISAVGRDARLGLLYDARSGQFLNANVLKQRLMSHSNKYITETGTGTGTGTGTAGAQQPSRNRATTESAMTNSIEEKLALLKMDPSTALNILFGITKPKGAATILTNRRTSSGQIIGTVIFKYRTSSQNIQIFSDGLRKSINTEHLKHRMATHVVTGISWGASMAITLNGTTVTSPNDTSCTRSKDDISAEIHATFENIRGKIYHQSDEASNLLNLSVSIKSDITIPYAYQSRSTSLLDVKKILGQIPQIVKYINGGRGVPQEFELTPLTTLKNHLNLTGNQYEHFLHTIRSSVQSRLFRILDDLSTSEQQLNDFQQTFYSNRPVMRSSSEPSDGDHSNPNNCTATAQRTVRRKVNHLQRSFLEFSQKLRQNLSETLIDVRSGMKQDSSLTNLGQQYRRGKFSPRQIGGNLTEFEEALLKGSHCRHSNKSEGTKPSTTKTVEFEIGSTAIATTTTTKSTTTTSTTTTTTTTTTATTTTTEGPEPEFTISSGLCMRTCTNTNGSFVCECALGYEGKNSDETLQDCAGVERCMNGGTCVDVFNNYTCNCAPGFEGRHCQIRQNSCSYKTQCLNGGKCVNGKTNYTCVCEIGFSGRNCQDSECANCSAHEKGVTYKNLTVIYLGCSGLITIPNFPHQKSFLLDYRSSSPFEKDEQCVWTVQEGHVGRHYRLRVKVTLLCDGFLNTGGALSVLSWDYYSLHHTDLKNSLTYETESEDFDPKLFLSFTSSYNKWGSGFLVLFEILQAEYTYFMVRSYFSTTAPERRSYGPFEQFKLFTIVVNPLRKRHIAFTVNYLDSKMKSGSCYWHDTMVVHEIPSRGTPRRMARLCGSVTSPITFSTDYPLLVTFYTYYSTTGKGFRISWK